MSQPQPVSPPEVVVRRSARRRSTVSAHREGEVIVVDIPARLSRAHEEMMVPDLVRRLLAKERRHQAPASDAALASRSRELLDTYLEPQVGPVASPASVRWVSTMRKRWGSCTTATREIRLSDQLQMMPSWVVDFVLLHELTHLVETRHTPRFKRLLAAYEKAERAEGFLEGWQRAREGSVAVPADD